MLKFCIKTSVVRNLRIIYAVIFTFKKLKSFLNNKRNKTRANAIREI